VVIQQPPLEVVLQLWFYCQPSNLGEPTLPYRVVFIIPDVAENVLFGFTLENSDALTYRFSDRPYSVKWPNP